MNTFLYGIMRNSNHTFVLAFTVIGLVLVGAATVTRAEPLDVHAIEKLIVDAVEEHGLIGLSVGVMSEGRVVLAKGYGVRSLSSKDPVTVETMFAIASITKQFTCAALMLLAEDGKLSPKNGLDEYLPNLTRANEISLLDLGQHVAGYRDYYPMDFVDRAMATPKSAESIILDYATKPLDFEPGTQWSYSNTGYLILGSVIESVSGESFGRFLDSRILVPLGMRHTQYEPRRDQPDQAVGYTSFALGAPEVADSEGEGWAGAAVGLWSTPSDLLVWDLALVDGKVISPASYRTMTTPARLRDGRSTGYGCGLWVRDGDPAVVLSHSGDVGGFSSRNTVVPATRSGVVLLSNYDGASSTLETVSNAIAEMLVPPTPNLPTISGPAALVAAMSMMRQFQSGDLDRTQLGEEFNAFLTPKKVKAAAASLSPLGEPQSVEVLDLGERGGMEVSTIQFRFEGETVEAWMYRTPNGRIQQFLVERD